MTADPVELARAAHAAKNRAADIVATVVAVIVVAVTLILTAQPSWVEVPAAAPWPLRERLGPLLARVAAAAVEEFGDSHTTATASGNTVFVKKGASDVAISSETLIDGVERAPFLTGLALATAIAVWRTRGLTRISGTLLVVVSMLLVGPLLTMLNPILQGSAVGLASPDLAIFAWGAAKAAVPGLTCALIVGLWSAVSWVNEEEGTKVPGTDEVPPPRPPSLWAAAIAVTLVMITWNMAVLGALVGRDSQKGWIAARYEIGSVCSGAAVVLVVWSLTHRSRAAQWASVPMLLMVAIGSEMMGGAALLLTSVAAGDERVAARAGQPLNEEAWKRIGRHTARPLRPWVWLLAAVAIAGAAVQIEPWRWARGLTAIVGHPAVFIVVAVSAAVMASWEAAVLRHRSCREWRGPAVGCGIVVLCVAIYGFGWTRAAIVQRNAIAARNIDRARMRAAAERIPMVAGEWVGTPLPGPTLELDGCDPQAVVYRRYTDRTTATAAELLVVCVGDRRGAIACDPALVFAMQGCTLTAQRVATWRIGGAEVLGMEYEFTYSRDTPRQIYAARLLVSADGRFITKLDDALATGGVAHVQVTMAGSVSREQREQAVTELAGACMPVIEARGAGKPKDAGLRR